MACRVYRGGLWSLGRKAFVHKTDRGNRNSKYDEHGSRICRQDDRNQVVVAVGTA